MTNVRGRALALQCLPLALPGTVTSVAFDDRSVFPLLTTVSVTEPPGVSLTEYMLGSNPTTMGRKRGSGFQLQKIHMTNIFACRLSVK